MRQPTSAIVRCAVAVLMLAATGVAADVQIHRCTLDDGTVAFQETPCLETKAVDEDNIQGVETPRETPAHDDFVNPYDEAAGVPMPAEQNTPEPVSQDRAECENTARDAIDAIDLEMRETDYTKEQGEAYLAELLALTRQLRACKQL